MKPLRQSWWVGLMSVAVIALAAASIHRFVRPPRLSNAPLHQAVGVRLAEEVASITASNGTLVLITLEKGQHEIVDAQVDAFRGHLARWPGLRIVRTEDLDARKGDKYGPGTGLSARRLLRLSEKEPDASLFVSFLGAPDPEDLPTNGLWKGSARLVTVSRSAKELAPLLQGGVLARAVVPRFSFPAPGPESPRTAAEWFENRYQVVRAEMAR